MYTAERLPSGRGPRAQSVTIRIRFLSVSEGVFARPPESAGMRLRRLVVRNYRGISSCDWKIAASMLALVGPGDATKSTLLDAIGAVLHPHYTLTVTDSDFYGGDTSQEIVITVVVTDPPTSLLTESQLGADCSGLLPNDDLVHDPIDGAEPCLVVQLRVGEDLEPSWTVVRPGGADGIDRRPISSAQRRALGFFRLGEQPNTHLRWSRASALSSFTSNKAGHQAVVAARRSAREAVFDHESVDLADVTAAVAEAAVQYGSAHFMQLRPGLEADGASSANSLMLHDGNIPLSNFGLGTRRLTSLAIQSRAVPGHAVITIDEIEHGLEPHRLAHLLQKMIEQSKDATVQVLFTTHSPVVVQTLSTDTLGVVRTTAEGVTTVTAVPNTLAEAQGAARSAPSALLGRRIGVGEGATEVGLMRGVHKILDSRRAALGLDTSAVTGFVLSGGDGNKACPRATVYASLGYPTLALVDNDDRSIDSDVVNAQASGATVLRWAHGNALEHQLAADLDEAGLEDLLHLAADLNDLAEASICQAVESRLSGTTSGAMEGLDPTQWATVAPGGIDDIRSAIGRAAVHGRGWFKRESRGEALSLLIDRHFDALASTTTGLVLGEIVKFAYDDPSATFVRAQQASSSS